MKRRTHFELRAAMRIAQISPSQMARAFDVLPTTVWRWTSGLRPVPGYVWSMLGLLDWEEPDAPDAILAGNPKKWDIEYDDVFPDGETYKQLVKKWHPDVTRRDTGLEMSVINEFKNF